MHNSYRNLLSIQSEIKKDFYNVTDEFIVPNIIAVSKAFSLEHIAPLINAGHLHFGENKIQEAEKKWTNIKKENSKIQLHFIGKLQTNKVKKAVKIFDYIHSLDNKKLALKLSQCQKELEKNLKYFIQVKFDENESKSGINLDEVNNFYSYCTKELSLDIIGLMCLPPINSNSQNYFRLIKQTAVNLNLNELSMGMSGDFEQAILNGSTYLRLGTLILGKRKLI